jgi:hypothetical protein
LSNAALPLYLDELVGPIQSASKDDNEASRRNTFRDPLAVNHPNGEGVLFEFQYLALALGPSIFHVRFPTFFRTVRLSILALEKRSGTEMFFRKILVVPDMSGCGDSVTRVDAAWF